MSDPTADAIRTLALDVALVRVRWPRAVEVAYGPSRGLQARAVLQQVRSAIARAQGAVGEANAALDVLDDPVQLPLMRPP
jgi:hypothetical protein